MNLKPYPKYKPAKNKWVGCIPNHWQDIPIKFALSMPITDGPHETPALHPEGIPFLSAEAVKNGRLDFEKRRGNISEKEHKRFCKKYKPALGDVYMVKSGATTGNVARVEIEREFNIWSPLAALRPDKEKTTTDFLFYYMHSLTFTHSVKLSWSFGTQQNIGMGVISNLPMMLPDVDEQCQITRFLDRETGKIDELVAEKEKMLGLLEEKRQAIITDAVTGRIQDEIGLLNLGTNPSGSDWIGDIPKHWRMKKLRYLGRCQNGINIGGDKFGKGYPFISYGDVYNNLVLPLMPAGLVESTEKDRQAYSVKMGDVLFTRTSETADEIGFAATCLQSIEDAVFAGFLIRFRPTTNDLYSGFAKYYFSSRHQRGFFVKHMNLVTRASLSQELLKSMPVLLPPPEEQQAIADYLDKKTVQIDELRSEIKSAIDQLKEHRTALVTAAVTGQIDVREV